MPRIRHLAALTLTIPIACKAAEGQAPVTDDFTIHVIRRFGDQPTSDDPDGAWSRFLANAPLDDIFVHDTDIEAVATDPLTLVLTARAGAELVRSFGTMPEHRFVATLGTTRLFAGRIVFVGTARALHHPVIHVDDTGLALTLRILPTLGAVHDNEITAPRALLDHFRGDGRLLPAGAAASPPARYRRWLAEVASPTPGQPVSQLEAECRGSTCTLRIAERTPGSATWKDEQVPLELAEFDQVWNLVERMRLVGVDPKPAWTTPPRYPTHWRWRFTLERATGERIDRERDWISPSTADRAADGYFRAAAAIAQRLARTIPVGNFSGIP